MRDCGPISISDSKLQCWHCRFFLFCFVFVFVLIGAALPNHVETQGVIKITFTLAIFLRRKETEFSNYSRNTQCLYSSAFCRPVRFTKSAVVFNHFLSLVMIHHSIRHSVELSLVKNISCYPSWLLAWWVC